MRDYTGKTGRKFTFPEFNGEVPAGKAFYAWNTREDMSGQVYKAGKSIQLNEDLHIWPMFIDANANDEIQDEEESE